MTAENKKTKPGVAGAIAAFLPAVATTLAITTLCIMLFTSCEHKDLCYHHEHYTTFRLAFDWRDAPDADPAGMVVFFYPEDPQREVLRYDFTGRDGGEITVPQGKYRLLTYNNDTSGVRFSGTDNADAHTAFTRGSSLLEPLGVSSRVDDMRHLRAEGSEEERVVLCPDMMWGCHAVDVEVTEQGVSYICVPESEKDQYIGKDPIHTEYVVTLYPHELTCIYTFEIRNVKNVEMVSRASATLSGMSPALHLFSEELDRECVTLPFEAGVDPQTGYITGSFITFGHHEENTEPHKMVLYVLTKDNKALYFGAKDPKFDVTDQVHSAPNKRRVHLIIDGIEIPGGEIPDTSTGFDPGVDDWIQEDHDVPM